MENEAPQTSATEISTSTLLEDTKKVVAELKVENDRHDSYLKEQRELEARRLLGGKTDAGIQPPKPVEETPQEYVKRIMSGKI